MWEPTDDMDASTNTVANPGICHNSGASRIETRPLKVESMLHPSSRNDDLR